MMRVRVDLGPRSYDIAIPHEATPAECVRFATAALDSSAPGGSSRAAFLIADENTVSISAPYAAAFAAAGWRVATATVPPGEGSKRLDSAGRLYDQLAAMRADRATCVVAVGGGVVGDLAGFVASTYARGLPLFMIPTTLLAQVDSSVGGKVGINLAAGKNLVGAFHQPVGVWIDLGHLRSLPQRERRCGLAEVIKYGMILDAEFFGFLEQAADRLAQGDPADLRRAIARSCELKARVVAADEYERTGIRACLNFGHTIGHAVEAVAGYDGAYQHGEAVAVGMVAEARLAERLGLVDSTVVSRLVALLGRVGLPTAAPSLDPDCLIAAMALDKKNRAGEIRFVLPDRIGSVGFASAPDPVLREVVGAMVAG